MNKEMDEEQVQDHLKDEETGGGSNSDYFICNLIKNKRNYE